MKQIFICVWLAMPFMGNSSVIQWDGEGADGLWNTAANWSGDIIPTVADDVILNNVFVSGTYTVNLPPGTDSVLIRSLTITAAGSNFITLILPAVNIANPGLSVKGSGDAIILEKGAIIQNSSGAADGQGIALVGSLRINNGARYIHRTSRGSASIVSQLSTVAGTELGVFEYDVPTSSYTLSLSGRTYGTLELTSIINPGTNTYSGTGASPLTIRGDLKINTGAVFSISMSADVVINGNYLQADISTFNLQTAANNNKVRVNGDIQVLGTITESGTGLPTLELTGAASQTIAIHSIINNVTLIINNASGAVLQSPVGISYRLQLIIGKIKTTSVNLITLADNAVCTGGSSGSFIDGPLRKVGDDDFDFPVGKGGIFSPIGISAGGNVTDIFTAEYMRANPQSTSGLGNVFQLPIDHISYVEYWKLTRDAGTSAKNVRLTVTAFSFATQSTGLLVSSYNGTQWTSEGGTGFIAGPTSPPYLTGTFSSVNMTNSFNAFAIGSTDNVHVNPLPVELISFNATKVNGGRIGLSWQLADYPSVLTKIEIQAAAADYVFKTVAERKANAQVRIYQDTLDKQTVLHRYYRLKITDESGVISYSKVVAIIEGNMDFKIISLSPNPVSSKSLLYVVSDLEQPITILIVDMQGRLVRRKEQRLVMGKNSMLLTLDDLAGGVYQLIILNDSRKKCTIRFVRN